MSARRQIFSLHDRLHAVLRISLGWVMFWSFIDKLFGLGFATKPENAWLAGGSPTTGFLKNAVHGPFAELYQSLSGSALVDWLFMLGLLGVGTAFLFGIAIRFSGYVGALMLLLVYTALLPPANNPVVDDHLIYALLFVLIAESNAGRVWGFQESWRSSSIVKSFPFLQ